MKQYSSQNPPILKPWSVRMVDSTLQRYTLKDALWHYEHGLQVMAIQHTAEATGEARYLRFVSGLGRPLRAGGWQHPYVSRG